MLELLCTVHVSALVCLGIATALQMWLNCVISAVNTSVPDGYIGLKQLLKHVNGT